MRVNFYGPAGSGKSTVAHHVFARLRQEGVSAGFVTESVKRWAYLGLKPHPDDQVLLFGQQLHDESLLFRCGVQFVVNESPLLLQCAYAFLYGFGGWLDLLSLARQFEDARPSLNFFLPHGHVPYEPTGRYEDAAQAAERGAAIRRFLVDAGLDLIDASPLDPEAIVQTVLASAT